LVSQEALERRFGLWSAPVRFVNVCTPSRG
jgi:hypothetical protein